MTTFLGMELSKEEELFLTSVIIDLVSEEREKIKDEEVFHRVLKMATCKNRADVLMRELRKKVKQGKDIKAMQETNENTTTAYWDGFMACADMVKEILQETQKYNYQFMQRDESGKYMPDMAKLKANASCKEEVDYLTEVENRWEEYRKKGYESLIGFHYNMCYVMRQACGHFEIFQTPADNDAEAIKWLKLMEEEAKKRKCTQCVCGGVNRILQQAKELC